MRKFVIYWRSAKQFGYGNYYCLTTEDNYYSSLKRAWVDISLASKFTYDEAENMLKEFATKEDCFILPHDHSPAILNII